MIMTSIMIQMSKYLVDLSRHINFDCYVKSVGIYRLAVCVWKSSTASLLFLVYSSSMSVRKPWLRWREGEGKAGSWTSSSGC